MSINVIYERLFVWRIVASRLSVHNVFIRFNRMMNNYSAVYGRFSWRRCGLVSPRWPGNFDCSSNLGVNCKCEQMYMVGNRETIRYIYTGISLDNVNTGIKIPSLCQRLGFSKKLWDIHILIHSMILVK